MHHNSYDDWLNDDWGAIASFDGWRGPLFETYDGYYTDVSKGYLNNLTSKTNNSTYLLQKLRQEGYDIIIVRFYNGIGYLQHNAFVGSLVLKEINNRIINETEGVENPGAALDPEASGYPNSTKIKKAKHELVLSGYSAGALTGRMSLLLMEYEHEKYKCTGHSLQKARSTPHRVKTWIGVDHETQGSNTPIGLQMFWDFQGSAATLNLSMGPADIYNSLVGFFALNILKTDGIARQNTLYHINNLTDSNAGDGNWTVGHDYQFDGYFGDLENITPSNYPANLKGYPQKPYRISVSQGSANGVKQLLSNSTNLLQNLSPSNPCFSSFPPISFYRKATARVLSSWNNDAFDCELGIRISAYFGTWNIDCAHPDYYKSNYVTDKYKGGWGNYDEAPGSTLPSHLITDKNMKFSFSNIWAAAFFSCNYKEANPNLHGFAPTVSGLDLHLPGNNTLPRLPNLSLVPGNVNYGLQLMQQNKYNQGNNNSPKNDFGYPHLTFPTNHYDYTPFDAIWANTRNDNYYDDNNIHVEDPNPDIADFLVEEVAPHKLYLSNRTIAGETYNCGNQAFTEKYYADFEARNSVLAGNQSIYQHDANPSNWYKRQRTEQGDFVIDKDAVVTIRANNADGQSAVTLGAGFSAKAGSVFRAYVYGDSYCPTSVFKLANSNGNNSNSSTQQVNSRPINTKRVTSQKLTTKPQNIAVQLYPNPTIGQLNYIITNEAQYQYELNDITGKIIMLGQLNQNYNSIDLSSLDKGIYTITIKNATYLQTDRIILQ